LIVIFHLATMMALRLIRLVKTVVFLMMRQTQNLRL
jgi:hypothetical protein